MRRGILVGFLITLLMTSSVLAAAYSADITVTEGDGNSYTQLPVTVLMDNSGLASSSFISSTGLDTRVLEGSIPLPHMLADDRTLFSTDITANTQHLLSYTTDNSPLSSFYTIVGYNGYITVDDSDDLELGDNFEIELRGYIDTSAGSGKNLAFKDLAFKIWVSGEKEISASIYKDGGWTACVVTAADITSGVYLIEIIADVQNLGLYIDGDLKDTEVLSGTISVPNNTNGWSFATNGSMIYVEWLKIWVD